MVSIRDLKLTMVVVLVLLVLPVLLDGWESCAAVSARVAVWDWLRCPCLTVEDAGVAVVEENLGEFGLMGPLAQTVISVRGDVSEDIRADIPSTKRIEIPVGLNCGDLRVMVVEVVVSSSDKLVWDGVTDEDSEDFVLDGVCLVLIKGDQNESVVHKSLVGEEGSKKAFKPYTRNSGRSVMTITGHVRGDEHPLRKLIGSQILKEKSSVLQFLEAVLVSGHRIVYDQGADHVLAAE
jgi:hypothetical protein